MSEDTTEDTLSVCPGQMSLIVPGNLRLKLDLRHSRRLLMEAQILSAGPSLMFMVEMRWSSRSSRSACPSISCDRNWAASSSQPGETEKTMKRRPGLEDGPGENMAWDPRGGAAAPLLNTNLGVKRWTCRLRQRSTEQEWRTGSWPPAEEDYQEPSCPTEERCAPLWSRSGRSLVKVKENRPPLLPRRRWTRHPTDWTQSDTTDKKKQRDFLMKCSHLIHSIPLGTTRGTHYHPVVQAPRFENSVPLVALPWPAGVCLTFYWRWY